MNGCKDSNKFNHQSRLLTTQLDLTVAMFLDYGRLLIIKTVHLHFLIFMKVVNLDLSFQALPKSANFDICNSNYGQISGQKSDLNKTIISILNKI